MRARILASALLACGLGAALLLSRSSGELPPSPPRPSPPPQRPLDPIPETPDNFDTIPALSPDDPRRLGAIERLLALAARPEQGDLRLQAQWLLRQTRLTRAELDALIPLAASDHTPVRLWALRILERRWELDPDLHAPLQGICRAVAADPDGKCREYACRVLTGAPEEWAVPLLVELSGDAEWNVRVAAARALKDYPGAKTLLETLSTTDPDPRVRAAATAPSPAPR